MTESQAQKRAVEEWEKYKEANDPFKPHDLFYVDNGQYFKKGYLAAWHDQQAVIQKLVEALEFYANRENWKFQYYSGDCRDVVSFSDLGCKSYTEESDYACSAGGRRAREALKQWRDGE